jgi:hypothetical protein
VGAAAVAIWMPGRRATGQQALARGHDEERALVGEVAGSPVVGE